MANNNSTPKEIIILLEESDHAKEFDQTQGHLIHQDQFEKVLELIRKKIPKSKQEAKRQHIHEAITILGSRGSGKTSFLVNLEKTIKGATAENDLAQVQIIGIIDPTLIEEKGHVFLSIISCIKELVEDKLDENDCRPDSRGTQTRTNWKTKLEELAAGLPSIDGIPQTPQDGWQDAEYIMENGLKAVKAATKLSNNFSEFLETSLDILGKKAFLVIFDDIDIDSRQGWAVLETIRKYLDLGQVITLISGDLRLYSSIVRQKKWAQLGVDLLKYEGVKLNHLPKLYDQVTELEAQYLLKILQPKHRFYLSSLKECLAYNKRNPIYIYRNSQDADDHNKRPLIKKEHEVVQYYGKILNFFGIQNNYEAEAYTSFLLSLPLRTQIQFLMQFGTASDGQLQFEGNPSAFADVFLSDLHAERIDFRLALANPKYLNAIILDFLIHKNAIEDSYQLQPTSVNESLNATLAVLSFLLSYNIRRGQIHLIFDYFIRVGYTRNLTSLLPDISPVDNTGISIKGLCTYSGMMSDRVLRDISAKAVAYVRGVLDLHHSGKSELVRKAGTIPLWGTGGKAKQRIDSTSKRIDDILKRSRTEKLKQHIVYIPLSANKYKRKQSTLITYSIFLLLGTIGELIRKVQLKDFPKGILELSQFRAYPMPDFNTGEVDHEETGFISEIAAKENQHLDSRLQFLLTNWVEKFSDDMTVSPHVMGKISTRLYYAIGNMESLYRRERLGAVFHSHIIAFLNSVVIEDVKENLKDVEGLNISNTNYKDNFFIYNISNFSKSSDLENKLRFSRWMLSCPLLIAYLNPDNKLRNSLEKYCRSFLDEESFTLTVYEILNKVPIKTSERPRQQSSPNK